MSSVDDVVSSVNLVGAPGGREYGNGAVLGVAVPQANPVVEPELAALLPTGFSMLVTRLQGSRSDSRQRLIDYLANLPVSLEAYDTASLS
ncbi:hypothetical protein AB8B21_31135 [Tardiphaga sp. 866_E4_N2_1]|uniref:hypothetical protein n=1 Tax=unclassified Tardiphaga TaxID=2631404 RepID=UPI003F22249E